VTATGPTAVGRRRFPPPPGRRCACGAAAAALVLSACATPAEPEGLGSPDALVLRLPESVAGFERREVLPPSPGEGRTVSYATRGRLAAGALVELSVPPSPPGGGPAVAAAPEGPDSPAATAALAAMLEEGMRATAPRHLREEGRLVLPAAGDAAQPPALGCAETSGRYGRERVQGLLCAGVLRGVLVRLRVSMPQASPPPADARAFASGIVAALRRPAAAATAAERPS
jgi:hypothetical protein